MRESERERQIEYKMTSKKKDFKKKQFDPMTRIILRVVSPSKMVLIQAHRGMNEIIEERKFVVAVKKRSKRERKVLSYLSPSEEILICM